MRIASLMLNGPGLSWTPRNVLPRGKTRLFAMKCPRGYVASMTKYDEKDGALDLK